MSKKETPITRWYWRQLGGLLAEEFCLVTRGSGCGKRLVDALVLPDRETRIAARGESIHIADGERAVLVQTKDSRLGMYLMGQTLFSADLLRRRYPTAAMNRLPSAPRTTRCYGRSLRRTRAATSSSRRTWCSRISQSDIGRRPLHETAAAMATRRRLPWTTLQIGVAIGEILSRSPMTFASANSCTCHDVTRVTRARRRRSQGLYLLRVSGRVGSDS